MELNDGNLQTLAMYLQKTLSPDVMERKPAEKFLESVEGNQNYPILLLHLVDKVDADLMIRVAAAITFKNYIKRNWRLVEDVPDKIHANDRTAIKTLIVGLMLRSPEQIQRQLSDAISIIGREDFPSKWPDLLNEMVSKFQSGDFHIINGILQTAHSLFKRYRHEFKSQELWVEIKFVLENFAKPLTDLFNNTMDLANQYVNDPVSLKIIFSSLVLIAKLFYSLNFQDLPEFFEDNMGVWMKHFLSLLTIDNKLLKTEENEEAGLLEQLRSQICDNITLYAQKYDEEFQSYLPGFVTEVWNLLVTTGNQVKYDLLVSNAIQFLASVAERPHNQNLFKDEAVLSDICQKVILPNIEFRAADEEVFEDNPEEYIRRDIEGSDIDTRRRSACDLVRALCRFCEGPVIQIFSQYVQVMLQTYSKNPAQGWRHKDAAIYVVTSLAAKGQTTKLGITQTSELVNITDFFHGHILPDLQSPHVNEIPVLKADSIKFIMIFRSQLPPEVIKNCIPLIINLLTANSMVVHTYAAHTLERIFTIKGPDGSTLIKPVDIDSIKERLLNNLFEILQQSCSLENEYVMKAIMRCFSLLQEGILSYIPMLLRKLTEKLTIVSKNPSKPHFNHYLFESISLAIRITCKSNMALVTSFEEALFPPFQVILQQDVQEFIPYVFQVLSLLLEMHETGVPNTYMELFGHLLVPLLWERPGNIPALVRLLQAFIIRGPQQPGVTDQLNGILGVFQKLLASKQNDHEGFYLLNCLIEYMAGTMEQYLKQVFVLLFQRLQRSKTTKYIKSLLVYFCLYACKFGADGLIQMIDSIQTKMFGMVIERLMIPDLQKVSGKIERKICAIGLTKILTESQIVLDGEYASYWIPLLQLLIGLFELPEDSSVPDDEHFIEIEETPGYQTAYSQLAYAGKREHDPFEDAIPNAKVFLANNLEKLSNSHPGKLMPMISTQLSPEVINFLQSYLQMANVALS